MATITAQLKHSNSSDARFKNWADNVTGISAQLAALGFTQTADTGQINWTTVTAPAQNTFAGYEIWRAANSANQTACPLFFKIEYGAQNNVVKNPRIRLTFGSGSDGAGVITGNQSAAVDLANASAGTDQADTTFNCYFCGDGLSYFGMLLWRNMAVNGNPNMFVAFERELNNAGTYVATYYTWVTGVAGAATGSSGVGTWRQQSILAANAQGNIGPLNTIVISLTSDDTLTTYITNSVTPSQPVFPLVGKLGNPMLTLQTVLAGDATEVDQTVSVGSYVVNFYGAAHTYIMTKLSWATNNFVSQNVTSPTIRNPALAMRWE